MTTREKNMSIAEMLGLSTIGTQYKGEVTANGGAYKGEVFFNSLEGESWSIEPKFHSDANWQFEAIEWINNLSTKNKNINNSYIDILHDRVSLYLSLVVYKKNYPSGTMSNELITHSFDDSFPYKKGKSKEAIFEALYQFSQYLKEKQ